MNMFNPRILFSTVSAVVLLVAATATHAQPTTTVYSVNVVGFQKVNAVSTNSGGLVLVANPFEKANPFIDRVVGTGGVAGANAGLADNVQVFNPGIQEFQTYWLFSSANPAFNRKWRNTTGFATNVYLTPGMGFWYRNRAGTNLPITLVGDVVTDPAITNYIAPGLQILSYPYSAPIKLGHITLTNGIAGSSVGNADTIQLYDPVTKQFQNYWLFSSANATFNRKYRNTTGLATNITIQPGQSFWFRSRTNVVMQWVETIPYNLSN